MFPRIARSIGSHPRVTAGIWALVLVVFLLAGTTGFGAATVWQRAKNGPAMIPGSDSWQGTQIINHYTESSYQIYLLVEGVDVQANKKEIAANLNSAAQTLQRIPGVIPSGVIHPFANGIDPKQKNAKELMDSFIAKDGHGLLVVVLLNLSQFPDSTDLTRQMVESSLQQIPRDLRSFAPKATGIVSDADLISQAVSDQARSDFTTGALLASAAVFVVSAIISASFWVALIALIACLVAVALSSGTVFFLGPLLDRSAISTPLICAIGMGLAVNFALQMVMSFRKRIRFEQDTAQIPLGRVERTRRKRARRYQLEPFALTAMEQTLLSTGKTIVLSAVTIGIGLLSVAVFPSPLLRSISLVSLVVLLGTVAAALTLVPALLFMIGPGLERMVRPLDAFTNRLLAPPRRLVNQGLEQLISWVLKRSWVALALCVVASLALALPALGMSFRSYYEENVSAHSDLAHFLQERKTQYGNTGASPDAQILAKTSFDQLRPFAANQVARIPGVEEVSIDTNVYGQYHVVNVLFKDGSGSQQSRAGVEKIRALPTNFEVLVTGKAAAEVDFRNAVVHRLWLVIALIVAFAFLLQWYLVGSLVITVQTVLVNALALGAALGLATVVFQDRFFFPQGASSTGGVESYITVLAACLGYSLLTDYQLITAGRMKDMWDRSGDTEFALSQGLRDSRTLVWMRGVFQFTVFAAFLTCSIEAIQQLALTIILLLAINLLVIRPLLLPALMRLTDERNWLIMNSARQSDLAVDPLSDSELILLPAATN